MPVVLPEKFSTKGWDPVLTVNGQVNVETGKLGVLDVMVKPLALVVPVHTEDPLKPTFFRSFARVAQMTVIELM
jgi:hypothetical protein